MIKSNIIKIGYFLTLMIALVACETYTVQEHGMDDEQLSGGRLVGTWGEPHAIVTPDGVPAGVFGKMRLVFTVDDNGYPEQFYSTNAPIVFTSGVGEWRYTTEGDYSNITLDQTVPVDNMNVEVSSETLSISFFMGWENTETGETGQGDFSVSLSRL